MLGRCMDDSRPSLYFGDPLGCDDAGTAGKLRRSGTCVAGSEVLAVEQGLLAAADGARGEVRLVLSCEQTGTLAEPAAGISAASAPALCEPCGVWISLDAGKER
jgi:hypothetical protein